MSKPPYTPPPHGETVLKIFLGIMVGIFLLAVISDNSDVLENISLSTAAIDIEYRYHIIKLVLSFSIIQFP